MGLQQQFEASARGVGGFAVCEVVLRDPKAMIKVTPQPAELHFPRVVQSQDGAEEIELYDGSKPILLFRPATLSVGAQA